MSHLARPFGRRSFTFGGAAAGVLAFAGGRALAAPKAPAAGISIGYAAITWGEQNAKTAMAEISAAGYRGIQLRLNILKEFATPEALKEDLAKLKLTFACLSGGGPKADPAQRAAEVEKFLTGAKFAKAAGALCVQATSPRRGESKPEAAELKAFAETLNEIGKQTADIGLPLAFHHHMAQLGETPEEVDIILGATDPRYVKLLLDTGHFAAAGGDPAKAIKTHGQRLAMLHIKDVKAKAPDKPGGKAYEFVELGQGKVDFKSTFAALKAAKYAGWAVVELDSVPAGRAPKDAAAANKVFIEKNIGLKV